MKAPFLFLFVCYANGFEDSINSYVFPTEDEVVVHHFTSNPRRSGAERRSMAGDTINVKEDNLEIKKSGKLLNEKMLSWLVTTTLAPKHRNYTVFPTVMMEDVVMPTSDSPYFPVGYNVALQRRSDIKMLPDPLMRRSEFRRRLRRSILRHRRSPRKQKIKAKSTDEIDDSYEPKMKSSSLRSKYKSDEYGDRSKKHSQKKGVAKQAFYHGSDLEKMEDKYDEEEPVKNDRQRSSEMYKNKDRNDKRSSEMYKNKDRHETVKNDRERSSEKYKYNDRNDKRSSEMDKYDKLSKTAPGTNIKSTESGERGRTEREKEPKRDKNYDVDDRKPKKGSFKPNPSVEYEKEEKLDKLDKLDKLEKRYKKQVSEDEKYSKGKKSGYQSERKRSEQTPREKHEKAKLASKEPDLEPVPERAEDRDVELPPERPRAVRLSTEDNREKKHKRSRKRHHKKSRATRKSKNKAKELKKAKNHRKSFRTTKLIDDEISYENFRRHYYSNPRRQKREIYGFEHGKPFKIGETRRLIAATTARIEDFPYMASIQKYGEHWCSGAILNQRIVITTANCVWRSIDASRMKVRVGSRHATDGGQIVDIQEVAKHPGWSLRQKVPDYDMALLLVSRAFKFCDTVHSVDLPNKNMYPAFDDAFIASFGAERRDGVVDDQNPTLHSYRAEMIPRGECNNMTKRFNVSITDNFICFAQRGRRAPCTRDTGAPAVSDGVVWGLASWSIRKKCGTERFPAVFSYTGSLDNIHFLINATLKLMSDKRLPTYYDNLGTLDPQGKRHPIGK